MKEIRQVASKTVVATGFSYNIRLETVPGLTEGQYDDLIAGEMVTLPAETADNLIHRGLVKEEK